MTALIIYQGLEERFRTIPWLRNIILGEPTAAHELPCLYTGFDRAEFPLTNAPPARNQNIDTYFFLHRLMIRWQDNEAAEMQLITWLNDIPNAIRADPKLSGRLYGGIAHISNGVSGFQTVGDTKYRIVDYTSKIIEKVGVS